MDEAVEDRVRDCGILELGMPVGHRKLAGEDDGAAAVSVVEDLEQIAAPGGVDRRDPPVVDDQQIDAREVLVGRCQKKTSWVAEPRDLRISGGK